MLNVPRSVRLISVVYSSVAESSTRILNLAHVKKIVRLDARVEYEYECSELTSSLITTTAGSITTGEVPDCNDCKAYGRLQFLNKK